MRWAALVLSLGGFILLSMVEADAPWIRHHDWNGALFSNFARNHLQYGLSVTRGMDLWNGGSGPPAESSYYLNHPPLITWWLTASFAIFGVDESVARMTGTLAIAAGLFFFWWKTNRYNPPYSTAVFGILLLQLPGFLLYSRMPGHEWPTMVIVLVGLGLCMDSEPSPRHQWAYSLVGLLLVWSSWVGWLFAAGFFLRFLLCRKWRESLFLAGGTGLGVILFLMYLGKGMGWDFSPLLNQFVIRSTSSEIDGGGTITAGTWIPAIWKAVGNMIGFGWFLTGILAVLFLTWKRIPCAGLGIMLFACCLGSVLLLRQWAYVHEYWAYYLSAPVILSITLFFQNVSKDALKGIPTWGFLLLAFWTPISVATKVEARTRPLTSSKHEWGLGQALNKAIDPDDLYLVTERPSPVFLYYSNRDFLIWSPERDLRTGNPAAFVQIHGALPPESEGNQIRNTFPFTATSPRIRLAENPGAALNP